jgi:hypothetical protein
VPAKRKKELSQQRCDFKGDSFGLNIPIYVPIKQDITVNAGNICVLHAFTVIRKHR